MLEIFTNAVSQEHLITGALFGFVFSFGFALNSLLGLDVKSLVIRVVHGTLSGVLAALVNMVAFLQLGEASGLLAFAMTAIWGAVAGFAGFIYVQAIFDKFAKKGGLDMPAARKNIIDNDNTLRQISRVKSKKTERSTVQDIEKDIQVTKTKIKKLDSEDKV